MTRTMMPMMMTRTMVLLGALALACNRTAESYDDTPAQDELEQLRIDACTALCDTMDRCDPDHFQYLDPPDCYESCTTRMPRLYAENQCGSREIQWMTCVGDLTCEHFEEWDIATSLLQYQLDYSCVAEYGRAVECDEDQPFDLDEDNSQYP